MADLTNYGLKHKLVDANGHAQVRTSRLSAWFAALNVRKKTIQREKNERKLKIFVKIGGVDFQYDTHLCMFRQKYEPLPSVDSMLPKITSYRKNMPFIVKVGSPSG